MAKIVKPKEKEFNISFNYFSDIIATCACGAQYKTGSTSDAIHVDICASCHPFFTGENKIVDSEGRVEKFKKKYAKYTK